MFMMMMMIGLLGSQPCCRS